MKPCMVCNNPFYPFDYSLCPGHWTGGGIEDHCPACVDQGRCPAIAAEFDERDPCGGPGIEFVQGYPISSHNI